MHRVPCWLTPNCFRGILLLFFDPVTLGLPNYQGVNSNSRIENQSPHNQDSPIQGFNFGELSGFYQSSPHHGWQFQGGNSHLRAACETIFLRCIFQLVKLQLQVTRRLSWEFQV